MKSETPAPLLTRKEHYARALLLGMVYKPSFGYYHTPIGVIPRVRVDALTLERIEGKDVDERQRATGFGSIGKPYYEEAPDD